MRFHFYVTGQQNQEKIKDLKRHIQAKMYIHVHTLQII